MFSIRFPLKLGIVLYCYNSSYLAGWEDDHSLEASTDKKPETLFEKETENKGMEYGSSGRVLA
jgi:hypothetical protein